MLTSDLPIIGSLDDADKSLISFYLPIIGLYESIIQPIIGSLDDGNEIVGLILSLERAIIVPAVAPDGLSITVATLIYVWCRYAVVCRLLRLETAFAIVPVRHLIVVGG